MFESQQKYTGTSYTVTVALLLTAFLFTPMALLAAGTVNTLSLSLAIGCTMLCTSLAWFDWKNYSELTIPSIISPILQTKGK